jgi:hypothetical protein
VSKTGAYGSPLTHSELQVLRTIVEAYPNSVPPDRLMVTVRKSSTEVGDFRPGFSSAVIVSWIRTKLGKDVIETLYPMRTNRRGKLVRVFQTQMIGYRLGKEWADRIASLLPEVTGASEQGSSVSAEETPSARPMLSQMKLHQAMGTGPA